MARFKKEEAGVVICKMDVNNYFIYDYSNEEERSKVFGFYADDYTFITGVFVNASEVKRFKQYLRHKYNNEVFLNEETITWGDSFHVENYKSELQKLKERKAEEEKQRQIAAAKLEKANPSEPIVIKVTIPTKSRARKPHINIDEL